MPDASAAAVTSMSASGSTTAGLLLPSSKCSAATSRMAAAATARAPGRLPVKLTARMRGEEISAWPASAPPQTSWMLALGRFASPAASCSARTSSVVPEGDHGDGLMITGQPAAHAKAVFLAAIAVGAFHGARTAAGPSGRWCSQTARPPVLRSSAAMPGIRSAAARSVPPSEPANRRVTEMGTPESSVSCTAIASLSASRRPAAACSAAARSSGVPMPSTRSR
jgi:hypothetical protein